MNAHLAIFTLICLLLVCPISTGSKEHNSQENPSQYQIANKNFYAEIRSFLL